MTPGEFIAAFDVIAEAPGGIERLRELVLQLAVRGKLVPQDGGEEPADKLVAELEKGKERLLAKKIITKSRYPCGVPVEREPFEIPETWQWLRLGDVSAIVGGGTPRSGESSFWSDGQDIPWLTPADMRRQPSRYISRGERDITSEGLSRSSAQMLPAGSVLFSSRAPIGHVGIAANPLGTNQGFKSCVPYVSAMSDYLYVFLKYAGPGIDEQASGTTFKEVAGKEFALIPVPIAPLAEQQRIVAKFDELMGLIDRLEAARRSREDCRTAGRDSALAALRNAATPEEVGTAWTRIAERMDDLFTAPADLAPLREAVLQLAVRGRLVPQDGGDGVGEDLLSLLKKARIKWKIARRIRKQKDDYTFSDRHVDIPKNWTWARLYEIGQTQTGTSPSSNNADLFGDYIPFIKPGNMGGVEINYDGPSLSKEGIKHSRFVPANSILMVCIGATLGKVNKTTEPVCFNQQINSLTTYLDIDTLADYIVLALKSPDFQKLAWSKAGTGTLPIISKRKWEVLPIPLPPLAEQHRIVAKVDEIMGLIDRLEQHLAAKEGTQAEFAVAWAG